MKFDVDLVVFLNRIEPPFGETFERIDELLFLNFDNYVGGFISEYCLQTTIQGVQFDILLATNLVPSIPQKNPIRAQRKGIFAKFSNPETRYSDVRPYSADFIRSQPEIVHSAIRLAKFWLKTLVWFDGKAERGLSYMTELLICRCFELCRECLGRDPNMLEILDTFFRQLVDWDKINIFWTLYYDESSIPPCTLQLSLPLILDPANYWNNVAFGLPWENWLPSQVPL